MNKVLLNKTITIARVLLLFLFLHLFYLNAYTQLTKPGIPESFTLKNKSEVIIPVYNLNPINYASLLAEDIEKSIPNRYGVIQQLSIDVKKEGVVTNVDSRGTIWQFEVKSPVTYSLGIHFSSFHLPEGASVFIYDETHTQIAGAFTSIDNNTLNQLALAEFNGQHAIIEYFEPAGIAFPGELVIGSVSQAYKSIFQTDTVRVGINCPAGANWQDVKHSVCLMTFYDQFYSYLCSGFLVNNVREDGTPYFQSANHCITTNALAATLVTYFNFENSNCSSKDAPSNMTLSGATVISTSSYSDFTLLKLNQYPPASYNPYFAGWDASGQYPKSGACIHHPDGTPKCIAIAPTPPMSYAFQIGWQDNGQSTTVTMPNTHWNAIFSIGSVEPGSSGSPLFNENQLVIGQLHGGDTVNNFFGKFSLSWNYEISTTQQLKHWLDPDNTGVLSLEGIYSTRKPSAQFSTVLTQVCTGGVVTLRDQSKYNPQNWNWTISPSTYQFVNGTSSGSKNPQVIFNNDGIYSVTLIVSNTNGIDTLLKSGYITAGNLHVKLSGLISDSVCGCNLINLPLSASGAINYIFSIQRSDKIDYRVVEDSIYLSLVPAERKNGSFNSWVKVTGTQGTCSVSDSLLMVISMPPNDEVQYATKIWPGRNGIYSNFCASVEQNEPYPAIGTCNSSNSWCPLASGAESALNNTIWFSFVGPPGGLVSINTHGLNDRIAVYEADSASLILSGNSSSFKILAANQGDSTAHLENIPVEAYKTYWLQVDGANKAIGNLTIDLLSNSIEIFPNPSSGVFNVILSNNAEGNVPGSADVKIFTPLGKVVYSEIISVSLESNRFSLDLSPLPQGIYFMQSKINGTVTKAKLVLVK